MKFCALRAVAAAFLFAITRLSFAQYDDGSSSDVFYYSPEQAAYSVDQAAMEAEAEAANLSQQVAPMGEGEYPPAEDSFEPGVYDSGAAEFGYGDGCCDMGGCGDLDYGGCCGRGCCASGCRLWGSADYLHWWVEGGKAPPLITTSPDGTDRSEAGVLPNATVLYPTEDLADDGRSGTRLTLGYWLDARSEIGLEGSYFFLSNDDDSFSASSDEDGAPILARPFINAETALEDSLPIAFPDVIAGNIRVDTSSDIQGAEANFREAMHNDGRTRVEWLGGYRFFRLNESLGITEDQVSIDPFSPVFPLGTQIATRDNFTSRNEFHGGQLGLMFQRRHGRATFEVLTKVALGNMRERVRIKGATTFTIPDAGSQTFDGGFLALESNSGDFHRNRLTAIPEIDLNWRYQISCKWNLSVGYTFIYVSEVVRPGDQIDRRIDPAQLAGEPGEFPRFNFEDTEIWLQGLNVGLECRY